MIVSTFCGKHVMHERKGRKIFVLPLRMAVLGCLLAFMRQPAQCAALAPVISDPAPSQHSFYVEVNPSLISSSQRKKLQLTFNAGGVARWTQTVNVPALSSPAVFWVDYSSWGAAGGSACDLLIQIVNSNGSLSSFGDLAQTIPVVQSWASFTAPTTPLVPSPYTGVVVNGNTVSVWGRTYTFGNSLFLDQVNSQGVNILNSPVTLTGTVGGVPLTWTIQSWSVSSIADDKVVYTGVATSGSFTVNVTASIEFDGMARLDWTISPVGGSQTVSNLALVAPVQRSVATSFAQSVLSSFNFYDITTWDKSGDLTNSGWSCAFAPFFWLGNPSEGIQWFAENDLNWTPSNPNKYLEVDATTNAATLVCHLADGARTISSPMSFTFGLMATPIRPRKAACDMSGDRIAIPYYPEGLVNASVSQSGITIPASQAEFTSSGCVEADFRVDWNPAAPASTDTSLNLLAMVSFAGNSWIQVWWNWIGGAGYLTLTQTNPVSGVPVTQVVAQAPVSLAASSWHRLALNYGTTTQVYLDGVPVISATLPGPAPSFVVLSPFRNEWWIACNGRMTLARWRISNVQRQTSELQPGTAWVPDSKTTHLEELLTDPTTMNWTNPVVGSTSCPGYLGGNWTYDPNNHWLIAGVDGASITGIESLYNMGVRNILYYNWATLGSAYGVNGLGQGVPYNPTNFSQLCTLCDMYGMHVIPYTPYGISDAQSGFSDYIWEQTYNLVGTTLPTPDQSQGGVNFYNGCPASSRAAFNLWQINQIMADGAGGVFLDGGTYPITCGNPIHGDGVTDPLTSQPTSYDRIFDQREYMKSMDRLVKSYGSNMVVDAHCSAGLDLPIMSFVDNFMNGESMWASGEWQTLAQPSVFRADYTGRQYGFDADPIFYNNGPLPVEYAMAFAGIHGQTPRCDFGMYKTRAAGVWKLVDSFNIKTANWMPYYDSAGNSSVYPNDMVSAFTPVSSSVYASAFVHPGVNALVLVTNWSDTNVDSTIAVNWSALGLPSTSPVEVVNLNQMLPVVNGNIVPPLKQRQLTYLLIGAGATSPTSSYIYYDDFQGNDYSSRYTSDGPPAWQYTVADSTGNIDLMPAPNSGNTAFSTTAYKNGHFTNTAYTASLRVCFLNNASPSVSLWVLNNGWCPQATGVAPTYYGYQARVYNSNGSLVLLINRTNADGTVTNLYNNSASPYSNINMAQWSTMSATVNVTSAGTYLTLKWDGVSANGMPVSYSCQASDTSAQEWSGGAGIAVSGYPGNSSGGLLIDNLSVVGSYVTINSSKAAPRNAQVSLTNNVITRAYSGYFYVESDDRSCGIRVSWSSGRLAQGNRVTVAGLTSTDHKRRRMLH